MLNELDGLIIEGLSTATKTLLRKIPFYGLTMNGVHIGSYVVIPTVCVIGWGVFNVIIASNPKLKEKLQNGSTIANIITFGGLTIALIILSL